MKGRIRAFLLALTMILCTASVYGANSSFIQSCVYETNRIKILCSDMGLKGAVPESSKFTLSLSGEPLNIESVSTAGAEKLSATYYCLVDISSSVWSEQMKQIKEALNAICDNMAEGDSMALCTLGSSVHTEIFSADKSKLKASIDKLASADVATNLYAGVTESIKQLSTNSNMNKHKCLVVFSDGIDYEAQGITISEAEKAITESDIPVYTFAALRAGATEEKIEYGKLLGSFARISTGGRHFCPVVDNTLAARAGEEIVSSMNNSIVVNAEVSSVNENMDTLLLRASYSDSSGSKLEDTLNIYKEDINIESKTEESAIHKILSLNKGILAAIVAAIIIVLGLIIYLLARRSANKKNIEQDTEETQGDTEPLEIKTETVQESAPEVKPDYVVSFSIVGNSRQVKKINAFEGRETVIGNGSKGGVALDSKDVELSPRHCVIKCENNKIYIKHLDSKCETYVNGVPISKMGVVPIKNGDTLRIGSYEYRINSEKC